MAKFDSEYPVQISPENGDKILITSAQDGKIMALPFSVVMAHIQKHINEIDDELSPTSLHPVQNRIITQVINDILAQLQPVDDKEIISVLTHSDTAPENASDGDLYINTENNLLLEYQDNEWIEAEAKENVIYITEDAIHFYIYHSGEFIDTTGEPIDSTIYINNLNELDNYTESGIYRVCLTTTNRQTRTSKWYTFIIERYTMTTILGSTITHTLSNRDGYLMRKKVNLNAWSEWEEFLFASKKDITKIIKKIRAAL